MGLALHVQILQGDQPIGLKQFDSDASRTIKIGRLSSAQLKLEDTKVSRIHAVIEFGQAGDVSLLDMGSTVGTTVNGAKVHKVKLSHGDQVALGDTTLMVGIGGPPPSLAAPAPAMPAPGVVPGVAPGMVAPGQPVYAQPGQPAAYPGQVAAPGQMPGVAPQQMPSPQVAPQRAVPGQPGTAPVMFDGGAGGVPEPMRRITQERLRDAAVESKPHPALPPEPQLSAGNRVLEMRVYWGEVLLAMHHYIQPKRITIGENKSTDVFISSEGLPVEEFPLVRYTDDDYMLSFSSEMEGEVEVDGQVRGLTEIRGSSLVKQDEDLELTYNYKMPTEGRSLVHWGGATFALRFVPPTKPVPNEFFRNLDLQYINVLILSLFFHIAAVVTMLVYPYDTEALRQDLFDEPDRFADLILDIPEETEKTKNMLEKLKKKVEEKKPKEEKVELTVSKQVKVQKTQAQKSAEVKQKFSKLFSGGGGAGSMMGGGGGGVLSGTLSNVIGTTGAGSASAQMAGLGIRGSGPLTGGGMGTSRGIAGIGTAGRLGGGGLKYGTGVGIGKRKNRSMISLSTPVVMGALPPEVIKRVINENKQQIRYCYEVQLQRHPELEGRVAMKWIIAATGSVAKVQVKETSINNTAVERCIASKIKRWKFPPPAGGGIVEVNYPFVFRAS